jgi:pimeloyl-ACP methyl ester carboxylesterase
MRETIVLVHGGGCGAWCWEPMTPHLQAPFVVVDLPPVEVRRPATRRAQPDGLFDLTVSDWADATLEFCDARGVERAVLVGHSLGGLTIAAVAARAPARVARLVFVSAAVPPEGGCVLDTLPPELATMSRDAMERLRWDRSFGDGDAMPEDLVRQLFCSDMDDEQTAFMLDHFGNEVVGVIAERVSRAGIPPALPKTYVKLRDDCVLTPAVQDELIANLRTSPGGPVEVVEVAAGHMAMISRPALLAETLDATTLEQPSTVA